MVDRKRGLGKGLSELGVGELLADIERPVAVAEAGAHKADDLKTLQVEQIKPGRYQPRQQFDEAALDELASSIKSQGIIQPIVVRQVATGGYEIIAGERRWRAAKLAGLAQVPVVIKTLTDEAAIAMSLIENIQRQDLNVVEEAVALQRLISEFDMTHQQVADAVGKSRTTVTNLLRLLNLESGVRRMLEKGMIEMGHARALLPLPEMQQIKVANYVVAKELSVRDTEKFIKQLNQEPSDDKTSKTSIDPDVKRLTKFLGDTLGAKVDINYNSKGKGKMVIHYNSLAELDGILKHIKS